MDARLPYFCNLDFIKDKGYFTPDEAASVYELIRHAVAASDFFRNLIYAAFTVYDFLSECCKYLWGCLMTAPAPFLITFS